MKTTPQSKPRTANSAQIKLRPVQAIQPYPGNPRANEHAVDAVAASIREFGFRQPIVVDAQGVIVTGHTRWKAAKKLGLAKVPVLVAADLTPEQVKAYRIVDNKTAELADWDLAQLAAEFADLDPALNMAAFGFSVSELRELLPPAEAENATEGDTKDIGERFSILVECDNETQQTALLERFQKEGLTCKAYVL